MFFQVPVEQPTVQPEAVFSIGQFTVTNAMMMGLLVTIIFFFLFATLTRKAAEKPGKFQAVLEMFIESVLTLLESITGNREKAKRIFPLIGTLFIYIGFANIITLLVPFLTSFTYEGVPLLRTPSNDFNFTFSIALAMVVLTQFAAIKAHGILGYIGNFIKVRSVIDGFKQGIGAGFTSLIDVFVGLLDIISEIAKVISLSLRLFGNMFAGEMLAAILLGSFAFAVPSVWMAMNLLVGILQALVFGALTAAYYSLATEVETTEEQPA